MIDIIKFIVRFFSILVVAWAIYVFLIPLFGSGIIGVLLTLVGLGITCFIGIFITIIILWAWDQL